MVQRRTLNVMFNVVCYARVWRHNRLYDYPNVACSCGRCYHNSYTLVGDREHACVAPECCRIFPRGLSVHFKSATAWKCRKIRIKRCKKADFIRYWRRSGFKNPDKPKIFIKKKVWNHSYHRFYPVLAKIWINRIRINRGLLYNIWFWKSHLKYFMLAGRSVHCLQKGIFSQQRIRH